MKAIFAVDAYGGFGTGTDMPWPTSREDLQRFKRLTSGQTVVMGSGTWNSNMPKPLPNRRNCVLSTTLRDSRCEVFFSVEELCTQLGVGDDIWVIGGERVLWALRPYVHTVCMTRFKGVFPCTVRLDTGKYLDGFVLQDRQQLDDHVFDIWQRMR